MFLKKATNKISTWLLWEPIKFAIVSMLAMTACVAICTMINPYIDQIYIPMAIGIGLLLAIILYVWRLPSDNMPRREFVALNSLQMFVANLMFIIITVCILMYIGAIDANIIMSPNKSPLVMSGFVIAGLIYMYLLGVFIGNIYAKYRRARTMGVAPWKIICAMPFGFSMLWIAGYMLPDAKTSKTKSTGRYAQLVDAICSKNILAYAMLAILILMSGPFTGIKIMAIALAMIVVFATWLHNRGAATMRNDITQSYSIIAIAINITMIMVGILLMSL